MRDTLWLQKAAAALTATLKLLKTKMVGSLFSFLDFSFYTDLHLSQSHFSLWYRHVSVIHYLSSLLRSEEKIHRRFEVQQPHEHWQEKTLLIREPREMCRHLR